MTIDHDQPHYEFTCDAGNCDAVTMALILGGEGWTAMCRSHAIAELTRREARAVLAEVLRDRS